jgi:hypothetical protein
MEADLIKHFFLVELLDHFKYRSSQIKMGEHGEFLEVEFEEKDELPDGYARQDYESKDFIVRRVQDFPIRRLGRFYYAIGFLALPLFR